MTLALPLVLVAVTVALALGGVGLAPVFLLVVGAVLFGAYRVSTGPLAWLIARWPASIRWKIVMALAAIGGLVLFSTIVNIEAMDYMHQELHEILDSESSRPGGVLAAVDALEETQHGPLFGLTPLIAMAGLVAALALGIAIARSVIDALDTIESGMRRIARGNFSEPVVVSNRDEFGRLAAHINDAADQLKLAEEATRASERDRALRERIVEITRAQEEERRRISRELHDDLGPSLAALANRIRTARQQVRTAPAQVEDDLGEIAGDLSGYIRDIRKLMYELRPLALDQVGLVGALRQHVERFGNEEGVRVSFSTSTDVQLHPFTEMTVFRVVQEALSNVQRHSGAGRAAVQLSQAGSELEATVEDDGRGFDVEAVLAGRASQGLGLLTIQERAELVGGIITIVSKPGAGCRVTLRVPLEEAGVGTYPNAVS